MAWSVSAAAAALLASNEFTSAIKVEVWFGDVFLRQLPITGGSVSEDETASPRRTLTVTVEDATLVPRAIGDLLHPLSGNELRPFWGITIPGQTTVSTTVTTVTPIDPNADSWDAGTTWDQGTTWDDTTGGTGGGGGGGTTPSGDGSMDSGTTMDSGATMDAPSSGGGGIDSGSGIDSGGVVDSGATIDSPPSSGVGPTGEQWDEGTTWDQGTTWDDASGGTSETIVTTVTETATTVEWVPLGVFRMTQPSTTHTAGSTIITINGHDRSSEISLRQWTFAYRVPPVTVDQAIEGILKDRWGTTQPQLQFALAPVPQLVPPGTVLGITYTSTGASASSSASSGNDPWADCVSLAQSIGCELLFDRQGIVQMRPVPQTTTVPVTSTFVNGVNSRLVNQVVRELDETSVVNQVVMIGTGATITNADGSVSPGAPITATASDNNPASPTFIGGQFGVRPKFITNAAISDVATCVVAANAALTLALASLDDTSFEAIPDPTVDAGDCDELVEPAVKVSDTYIVSAVTHPLDFTSAMQITNRGASVLATTGTGPPTTSGSTLPDMIVSFLPALTGFSAGDSIQFAATVANIGSGPTPTSNVATGSTAATVTVVTFAVDGVPAAVSDSYGGIIIPGQSVALTANQGWTATAGDHVLTAVVNPANQYAESNASNNSLSVSFTVATAAGGPPTGSGTITWSLVNPPAGSLNTAYTSTFVATNATNFALTTGKLPVGLTLSPSGVLSGTPTTAAQYTFNINASNSADSSEVGPFTLNIATPYSYSPGGTYTYFNFPSTNYSSLQWTFEPIHDADSSLTTSSVGSPFAGVLHYYAMQFYIQNNTAAQGQGYAGFQTNGNFTGTAQGKVINFSIWGSTGGNSTNTSTMINAQNVESGGFQMMLRYNWTVGHSYLFNLAIGPGGVTSQGTWWGLTVTDTTTSTATYVGQQLIPNTISGLPSTALQGNTIMFGEDTHWWLSTTGSTIYTDPADFQNSALACLGMTANAGTVAPTAISYSTNTGVTSIGSNGFTTTTAKVTEYLNTSTLQVQHNLGFWSSAPPNTAVSGVLVY